MPLQATSGAASYDAFGGGVPVVPNYIEDVFSTYLYNGTGSAQTITNGIDLSGKGGMVWTKSRNNAQNHIINDTVRGAGKQLIPNSTLFQQSESTALTSFNANGFSLGTKSDVNDASNTYASWTFREQPKFFDVVTYTGNGSAPRDIPHSLASSPGFIVIKRTDSTGDWWAWHRSIANKNIYLNYTDAADSGTNPMISGVSSTTFTLATNQNATMNINGATYVAYLFAHNAGGFGLTGTDNVISCGSFTTDGSGNATVNLGYEPQWILSKSIGTGNWNIGDVMRGMSQTEVAFLDPNRSAAENVSSGAPYLTPTATGFTTTSYWASETRIYIAIRRGPMKVPTDATKVFSPLTSSASTGTPLTTGFPLDLQIAKYRTSASGPVATDRLRGVNSTSSTPLVPTLLTTSASAEDTQSSVSLMVGNTGFQIASNWDGTSSIFWNFGRAPSFMDVVCYTGTGSARTVSHNLQAVPELMIIRRRTPSGGEWYVYNATVGPTKTLFLNGTSVPSTISQVFNDTAPTSSVFTVGSYAETNGSGSSMLAYLFATCAGVSKVGSYTGNGSTQAISCGFTGGARFVLIKRTDASGGWYVYDTARGMTLLTDPYLFLNSTAAEAATLGSVTTTTGGFTVDASILAAINTNAASYIFLAIA